MTKESISCQRKIFTLARKQQFKLLDEISFSLETSGPMGINNPTFSTYMERLNTSDDTVCNIIELCDDYKYFKGKILDSVNGLTFRAKAAHIQWIQERRYICFSTTFYRQDCSFRREDLQ